EGTLAAGIGCRKIESREPSFMQEKVQLLIGLDPYGIVKSAGKVAFIIDNDKYVNGIECSIPVLIKSVSNLYLLAPETRSIFCNVH
uniref:Uncharacterized protein n=3 Tax=Aegilops tauschii subsp. strangulata TaxID=200361 RepID=A0A453RJX9_AEGTS